MKKIQFSKTSFWGTEPNFVLEALINYDTVSDIYIQLSMLEKDLLNSLTFKASETMITLLIDRDSLRAFFIRSDEKLSLIFDVKMLNYFLLMLLKFYRDGFSEVGHLDLTFYGQKDLQELVFIPTFPKSNVR